MSTLELAQTASNPVPHGTSMDVHSQNQFQRFIGPNSTARITSTSIDTEAVAGVRRSVASFLVPDSDMANMLPLDHYFSNAKAKRALRANLRPIRPIPRGRFELMKDYGASSILLVGPNGKGKTSMCLLACKEKGRKKAESGRKSSFSLYAPGIP